MRDRRCHDVEVARATVSAATDRAVVARHSSSDCVVVVSCSSRRTDTSCFSASVVHYWSDKRRRRWSKNTPCGLLTKPSLRCMRSILLFGLLLTLSTVADAGVVTSLRISPSGNDDNELTRAVGTSIVFTCEVKFASSSSSAAANVDADAADSVQPQPSEPDQTPRTVEWFDKNDMPIPENHATRTRLLFTETVFTNATTSVKKLYITTIHNKHAGLYTCAVVSDDRRVNETSVTLLLYRGMAFAPGPDVVKTVEGHSILIPCVVLGQPQPVVSWRNQTNKIKSEGRFVIQPDGLFIHNVTSDDEGEYYCQGYVLSNGQFKERRLQLILLGSPTYGNETSTTIHGVIGGTITIDCNAIGSLPIVYDFFKDNKPVDETDPRIVVNATLGWIRITSLRHSDSAKYLCMANNSVGKATAERTVEVHNTPLIYSFDSVIEARGMTATLLCLSSGQPHPRLTFYRHQQPEVVSNGPEGTMQRSRSHVYSAGHVYDQGRIYVTEIVSGCAALVINHITLDDAGVYSCESRNYLGSDRKDATVEIGHQPHFVAHPPKEIFAWPGQQHSIRLTCSVEAVPAPVLEWRHRHRWIRARDVNDVQGTLGGWRSMFHIYSPDNFTSVLEITVPPLNRPLASEEYLYDDYVDDDWIYGKYTCRASNFFGYDVVHAELVKADVPANPSSVTVLHRSQRSVELEVEPPTFNGGLNVIGYQVQNDVNTYKFELGDEVLEINGLKPSTQYLLGVAAVNQAGVGKSAVVAVSTTDLRPPAPVKIRSVKVSPENASDYDVVWYQPDDGGMPIRKYRLQYRSVIPNGRPSRRQWKPVDRWRYVYIDAVTVENNTTVKSESHSSRSTRRRHPVVLVDYRLSNLSLHTYYELHVRAQNDLEWSPPPSTLPPNLQPFVFLTEKSPDKPDET